MINKSELRIGNLVIFNKKVIVLGVDEFHEWLHADAEDEMFSPIPIGDWTEELFYFKDYEIKITQRYSLDYEVWSNGDHWFSISPTHQIKIKYIHQLQNLYFALKGSELKHKYEGDHIIIYK